MSSIFISYRRQDSAAYAGRLYDRLVLEFGDEHVFMDVDSIQPGADFYSVLGQKLETCSSMLVVIGPNWLSATDAAGAYRLTDPEDMVRQELIGGLEHGVLLIPVLVDGASMPGEKELPAELVALAHRQALAIGNQSFQRDVTVLIDTLRERVVSSPETQDLTGTWSAVVQSRSGQSYRIGMTLEQFENRLYGMVRYPTGEGGILEGQIEGNRLSFRTEHLPQFEQEKATIHFQGRLSGQGIEFVMQSADGYARFMAQKQT